MVRRRTDAPRDATVGWFIRYDATVQAERHRLGLDKGRAARTSARAA
jgi:hypothetical protein